MEGYESNSDCEKEQVYNIIVSLYNINRSYLKMLCASKVIILCMKLYVQTRWEVDYPRLSGDLCERVCKKSK